MFFGKKEDKKRLPDLPDPRRPIGGAILSPPMLNEDREESILPAFPDSSNHNRFLQAAIKDAVSDNEEEDMEEDDEGKSGKVIEMEEWRPSSFKTERPMKVEKMEEELSEEEEIAEEPSEEGEKGETSESALELERVKQRNDIFVKIDKYHSARRSLNEIRGKLDEVNALLKKIREIRMREEQELGAWEKDLAHVKSRIQHVTENIFEKLE